MEPDALMPGGTFVEFSWYSFESDGPMDNMPGPLEEAGSPGARRDNETLSKNKRDGPETNSLRLPPQDRVIRKP